MGASAKTGLKSDIAIGAIFLGLPVLLFWRLILAGEVLYWGTPLLQFFSWRKLAVESYLSGQVPLWNPYLGNGAPLAANWQSAVFYPLNVIYLIFPVEYAMGYSVVLHIGLASLFMYIFGRTLGLSRFASFLAGLCYGFSGFMVSRAGFLSMTSTATWLPLILAIAEGILRRGRSGEPSPFGKGEGRVRVPLRFHNWWRSKGDTDECSESRTGMTEVSTGVALPTPSHADVSDFAPIASGGKSFRNVALLVALGSLAVAFLLLAGHGQLSYYSLWMAVLYTLFRGWRFGGHTQRDDRERGEGPHPDPLLLPEEGRWAREQDEARQEGEDEGALPLRREKRWALLLGRVRGQVQGISAGSKTAVFACLPVAGMLVLGVGIAAVQLLPTAELAMNSVRSGGAEYDFAMAYSLYPWQLLGLVAPDFFGNPATGDYWGPGNYWETSGYIGVFPLLAAAVGAVLSMKRWGKRAKVTAWARDGGPHLDLGADQLRTEGPHPNPLPLRQEREQDALRQEREQDAPRQERKQELPFAPERAREMGSPLTVERAKELACNAGNDGIKLNRPVPILFLLGTVVVSLLLALGSYLPVYPFVFTHVPGFGSFQAPARFLLLYTFAAAVLAGIGADALLARAGSASIARLARLALIAGGGIGLAMAAFALMLGQAEGVRPTFVGALGKMGALLALSGIGILLAKRLTARQWQLTIGLLVAADLLVFGFPLNPTTEARAFDNGNLPTIDFLRRGEGLYRIYTPDAAFLAKFFATHSFRTFGPSSADEVERIRDTAIPDVAAAMGLQESYNYDPLQTGLAREFMDTVDASGLSPRLLGLMNVRYVLTDTLPPSSDLKLVLPGASPVYENPQFLDRAFVAGEVLNVSSAQEARRALEDPRFDPRRTVILSEPGSNNGFGRLIDWMDGLFPVGPSGLSREADKGNTVQLRTGGPRSNLQTVQFGEGVPPPTPGALTLTLSHCGGRGDCLSPEMTVAAKFDLAADKMGATITEYGPQRVMIAVRTDAAGYLVLGDTYYPGWKAWVDGQPATVRQANLAFRAVEVPAGQSTVEFRYEPASSKLGLIVSVLSLALISAAVAWSRRDRRAD